MSSTAQPNRDTPQSIEAKLNKLAARVEEQAVTMNKTLAVLGALTATGLVTANGGLTTAGIVLLAGLPTSDPTNTGQLWANAGIVTVSA